MEKWCTVSQQSLQHQETETEGPLFKAHYLTHHAISPEVLFHSYLSFLLQ